MARQLEQLLEQAVKARSSDIHIEPDETRVRIRYRIDGILHEVASLPLTVHTGLISRIKILSDMNIADHRRPQDGQFSFDIAKKRIDVRVATVNTVNGEMAVLRLLDKSMAALSLPQIGFLRESQEIFEKMLMMPYGMVLVTGPTGSGKTTTLYSILQGIYTPELKILTIEDPVEYELPGVAQIPVRPSRGFTFANGLRSILRQDPDVVMVGEIRDAETAEIAIRAALTGHQVFSTLHTNDATGAVTRLLDMGVEAFLISSSLDGVVAQRLVRRICPACRVESPVTPTVRDKLEALSGQPLDHTYYHGRGCEECRGTGCRGRIGIFELLPITPELRELILQKRSNAELRAKANKTMLTMHQDALQKAAAGLTSLEEILRVSSGDLLE